MPSALAEEWKPCAESRFLSEMAAPPTGRCSPALTASRTTPSGALDGVVREAVNAGEQRPVGGAAISLRNLDSAQGFHSSASAEGIFRLFPLPPGRYELRVESEGYAAFVLAEIALGANEVVTLEISLVPIASAATRSRLPRLPELGPSVPGGAPARPGTHRELRHRSEEHTSELQSLAYLVCRLLLEKKKNKTVILNLTLLFEWNN